MANYNLVIPTVTELCRKIGVPNAMVGIIIGCSDIATIPGTVGNCKPILLTPLLKYSHGARSTCLVLAEIWLEDCKCVMKLAASADELHMHILFRL